jgi:hypothetical protein
MMTMDGIKAAACLSCSAMAFLTNQHSEDCPMWKDLAVQQRKQGSVGSQVHKNVPMILVEQRLKNG